MSKTGVLKMDGKQINMLLSNHKLFTKDEVKLAAKMKVRQDKYVGYSIRSEQERGLNGLSRYNGMLQGRFGFDRGYMGLFTI